MARLLELRDAPARLCRRARAAIEVLASHSLVDGRLAAVGYCFGGMTVLQMGRAGMDFAGVVGITREPQNNAARATVGGSRHGPRLSWSFVSTCSDNGRHGICRRNEQRSRRLAIDRLRRCGARLQT